MRHTPPELRANNLFTNRSKQLRAPTHHYWELVASYLNENSYLSDNTMYSTAATAHVKHHPNQLAALEKWPDYTGEHLQQYSET